MRDQPLLNPAEQASERAFEEIRQSIDDRSSFILEAGAGAGKTYSLVRAIRDLIKIQGTEFPKRSQKIACITYTNVAKKEIESRTDNNPLVECETIHGFCWSLIRGFQKQLRLLVSEIDAWTDKLEEAGGIGNRGIEYSLGYRRVSEGTVHIHHDDVLTLAVALMQYEKFRHVFVSKYPIVLVDEYQDTNLAWMNSIKECFLGQDISPQFGFFGDHWQKIYGAGCGKLSHPAVRLIGKEANFRSVDTIVQCLNRMRPELPQFVVDPDDVGEVAIYHTNDWQGVRKKGQHWGGDLPDAVASEVIDEIKHQLEVAGWDLSSEKTKILMLTHRVLAAQQGYASLPSIFRYNDSFTKKEQPHVAFFVDIFEPTCAAFEKQRYGEMFEAATGKDSFLTESKDKDRLAKIMQRALELRQSGTVGEIVTHLSECGFPRLPESVKRLERELCEVKLEEGEEISRSLREIQSFHDVAYLEVVALARYLEGHSPFETKHGVKGAEFENVLVIVGRGWNLYNFNMMLEMGGRNGEIPSDRIEAFERNRNLFYVVCSRAKRRLAVLFTQELSEDALATAREWFGDSNVEALEF